MGAPETEMGQFMHAVEGEMLCASTNASKVPYFNAPIYLQNKSSIGKVDEILGPINEVYFTIKPSEGVQATSFSKGDKVFIGGDKLLPLERFLPKPKGPPGPKAPKKKRGAAGGPPGRGGRGGFAPRGGRGAPRGRGLDCFLRDQDSEKLTCSLAVRREVVEHPWGQSTPIAL